MTYNRFRLFEKLDAALSMSPNLTLRKFAQQYHIDRHTVEKAVREAVGVPFREYKKQRILNEIQRLLIEEFNTSQKEMAFKLGFHSPQAFCRFVKLKMGQCSTEIRRLSLFEFRKLKHNFS